MRRTTDARDATMEQSFLNPSACFSADQQAGVTMAKTFGSPARIVQRRAVRILLWSALLVGSIGSPALAQTTTTPGSTINGTVPTSEGNRWNGLDHQPTPSETVPIQNPHQQAKVNHKLNKLDQQLLNYKLPKLPSGAPTVNGN